MADRQRKSQSVISCVCWKVVWKLRSVGIENDGTCHGSDVCVAKNRLKRINDSITNAVDTLMLGELIEESRRVHEEKQQVRNSEDTLQLRIYLNKTGG